MTFLHIVAGGAFEELQNFFSEWGRKNLKNNAETYYTNENQRVLLLALQTRNYSIIHILVEEVSVSLFQYGRFS
jgi:hypothetical protein